MKIFATAWMPFPVNFDKQHQCLNTLDIDTTKQKLVHLTIFFTPSSYDTLIELYNKISYIFFSYSNFHSGMYETFSLHANVLMKTVETVLTMSTEPLTQDQ
jgi:hypothetical protein